MKTRTKYATSDGLVSRIGRGLRQFAEAVKKPQTGEIGVSGGDYSEGLPVAKYNPTLSGPEWFAKVDEMRAVSGGTQAMELVISLPLMDAEWKVEGEDEKLRQWVEDCLFTRMSTPWTEVVRKMCLAPIYGTAILEMVWEEQDGELIWDRLADRHPGTITAYPLDAENKLNEVKQKGVRPSDGSEIEVSIPTEKLLLFPYRMDFGNWQGHSILRPAYKHYWCLDELYRILQIGAERAMRGIPVGHLPPNYTASDQAVLQELVESLRIHEAAGITLPPGFDIKELGGTTLPDLLPAIEHHRGEILRCGLMDFLVLGDTAVGAKSLMDPKVLFAMMSWNGLGNGSAEIVTRHGIPRLVRANFGDVPREKMPRLTVSPVGQWMQLEALGNFLEKLIAGSFVVPDGELVDENYFRGILGMPERDAAEGTATAPLTPSPSPTASGGEGSQAVGAGLVPAPIQASEPRRFSEAEVQAAVAKVKRDSVQANDEWQAAMTPRLEGLMTNLLRQVDNASGSPAKLDAVLPAPALVEDLSEGIASFAAQVRTRAARRYAEEVGRPADPELLDPEPTETERARGWNVASHLAEAARFNMVGAALRGEPLDQLAVRFAEAVSSGLRTDLGREAKASTAAVNDAEG